MTNSHLKLNLICILLLSLIILPLQSCKKGKDDPALSLRSRKARMTGEWILKESKLNDENIRTDGNIRFTFEKDGKVTIHDDQNNDKMEGTWDFITKNDDDKNKERFVIHNPGFNSVIIYDLIELRNKKMHFSYQIYTQPNRADTYDFWLEKK